MLNKAHTLTKMTFIGSSYDGLIVEFPSPDNMVVINNDGIDEIYIKSGTNYIHELIYSEDDMSG